MPERRAYLDHNATTPLRPAAREAIFAALAVPGNASSIHAEGRAARAAIETARIEIGAFVGAPAKSIIFTSGGTEALNLALTPHFAAGAAKQPFDVLLCRRRRASWRPFGPSLSARRRRDGSADA